MPAPLETYRGVVRPWECDHMGHMNVMWYVAKFDEATWNLFTALGMGRSYMKANHRGTAAVEQTLQYRRELWPGETLLVRSAMLEVREKVLRYRHEMIETEQGEVAATCVLVAVHLDSQARKSCPMPEEVLRRARALV